MVTPGRCQPLGHQHTGPLDWHQTLNVSKIQPFFTRHLLHSQRPIKCKYQLREVRIFNAIFKGICFQGKKTESSAPRSRVPTGAVSCYCHLVGPRSNDQVSAGGWHGRARGVLSAAGPAALGSPKAAAARSDGEQLPSSLNAVHALQDSQGHTTVPPLGQRGHCYRGLFSAHPGRTQRGKKSCKHTITT